MESKEQDIASDLLKSFLEDKDYKSDGSRLATVYEQLYFISINGGDKVCLEAIKMLLDRCYGTPLSRIQSKNENKVDADWGATHFSINVTPAEKRDLPNSA